MKRNHVVMLVAIIVASAIFTGCAKPPTTELDAVKTALAAAEKAEAAMYADVQLNEAKQALADAEAELATQQGKFALARKYDHAKDLIAEAGSKAAVAEQTAVIGKQEAAQKAEDAVNSLNEAMTSIDGMIAHLKACPKKPKGFDSDMLVIGTQVDALKAEVPPIAQAVTDGDFKGAVARAEAVQAQVAGLTADLRGASEKIGCPMPEETAVSADVSTLPGN